MRKLIRSATLHEYYLQSIGKSTSSPLDETMKEYSTTRLSMNQSRNTVRFYLLGLAYLAFRRSDRHFGDETLASSTVLGGYTLRDNRQASCSESIYDTFCRTFRALCFALTSNDFAVGLKCSLLGTRLFCVDRFFCDFFYYGLPNSLASLPNRAPINTTINRLNTLRLFLLLKWSAILSTLQYGSFAFKASKSVPVLS